MQRMSRCVVLVGALALAGASIGLAKEPDDGGVIVGRGSIVRYLYPALHGELGGAAVHSPED